MIERRPIKNFKGYAISSDGIVWSFWNRGVGQKDVGSIAKPLKTRIQNNGYIVVGLWTGSKQVTKLVHRLVLEAFDGPCPEGMEACHINGNRQDNRSVNLRWDTRKRNHADKVTHGTMARGKANGNSRLREHEVKRIIDLSKSGMSQAQIAKAVGSSQSTVGRIIRGEAWRHVVA